MLKVIAENFIREDAIESVLPLYRELVEATKREPLCISYDLYIDHNDPSHFIFVEEWPSREALDIHCATEHFQRLVPLIKGFSKAESKLMLMDSALSVK